MVRIGARIAGFVGSLGALLSPNALHERSFGEIDFAFIFHPRDVTDIARKYPWVSFLPEALVEGLFNHFPPIAVSPISGLVSKTGKPLRGLQIAVPSTPDLLLGNRCRAQEKILAAVHLAERCGARVIGLGALTSSLTDRGRWLISKGVTSSLTTGHSLTVAVVMETAKKAASARGLSLTEAAVAIVGACGSVGSGCARWLAEENISSLILHDSREAALHELRNDLSRRGCTIRASTSVDAIREADILIVATNDPRQIIEARHLKCGCIIIDDAQPPNVSVSIGRSPNYLLAWGGLVEIPHIDLHMNIGLVGKCTVFSCLGEIVTLAAHEMNENYTIGPVDVSKARHLFALAAELGITLAPLQAFGRLAE